MPTLQKALVHGLDCQGLLEVQTLGEVTDLVPKFSEDVSLECLVARSLCRFKKTKTKQNQNQKNGKQRKRKKKNVLESGRGDGERKTGDIGGREMYNGGDTHWNIV